MKTPTKAVCIVWLMRVKMLSVWLEKWDGKLLFLNRCKPVSAHYPFFTSGIFKQCRFHVSHIIVFNNLVITNLFLYSPLWRISSRLRVFSIFRITTWWTDEVFLWWIFISYLILMLYSPAGTLLIFRTAIPFWCFSEYLYQKYNH